MKRQFILEEKDIKRIMEVIEPFWFDVTGNYNNDKIIELHTELKRLLKGEDERN